MSHKKRSISTLLALRDLLNDFSVLIKNLNMTSRKHKVSLNEIRQFNISQQTSIQELAAMLNPRELGLLVSAMAEIVELQDGMKNFMDYNPKQLTKLHNDLQSAIKKFDGALEKHSK